MIINDDKLDVKTSGVSSKNFSISLNRKMFSILSSGLYSNKISSIIREISCNCYDSHVSAGKQNIPFEIHLPNVMEPFIEFRDFGIGLSDEDILNLYTNYGSSTKTSDQSQVGAFGIGSKSPLAYTDSFTISSRFNGIESIFTVFLDTNGIPSISNALSKIPTKECNGFSVKFPVKHQDFSNFVLEAKNILQWFKIPPKVTGSANFTLPPKKEYLRQTPEYGVSKFSTGYSYCIMGNVAYPINASLIGVRTSYYPTYGYKASDDDMVSQLLNWGVELYVNIGDVEITASREALSYSSDESGSTKTGPFIKELCKKVVKDLQVELVKDIQNESSLWKAREKLHSLRTSFLGGNLTATWQGKTISSQVELPKDASVKIEKVSRGYASYRKPSNLRLRNTNLRTLDADGKKIFHKDSHGAEANLRFYFESNPSFTECYLVEAKDEWLKEVGLDQVIVKCSTLPKKPKAVGVRISAEKAKIYKYEGSPNKSAVPVSFWKPAEIDLADKGTFIYTKILYFHYYIGETSKHPNTLPHILDLIENLDSKKLDIYGIRPSDETVIKRSKGTWIKLEDYLKTLKESLKPKLEPEVVKRDYYNNLSNKEYFAKFDHTKFLPTSEFGQLINKTVEAKKAASNPKVNKFVDLTHLTGGSFNHLITSSIDELSKVQNKYPLLKYVYWYNANMKDFVDGVTYYVGNIDKGI